MEKFSILENVKADQLISLFRMMLCNEELWRQLNQPFFSIR